jgi:hypothetical protein
MEFLRPNLKRLRHGFARFDYQPEAEHSPSFASAAMKTTIALLIKSLREKPSKNATTPLSKPNWRKPNTALFLRPGREAAGSPNNKGRGHYWPHVMVDLGGLDWTWVEFGGDFGSATNAMN